MPKSIKTCHTFLLFITDRLMILIILMKTTTPILILLIALTLTQVLLAKKAEEYSFEDFKRENQKEYSKEEEASRKANFEKYREYMIQMEAKGIKIVPNQFMDRSEEEIQMMTGLISDQQRENENAQKQKKPHLRVSTGFAAVPDFYDYRNYGKVTSVKNQASCGSCYAFAALAQYQSLFLMLTSQTYDLSQQYIIQCDDDNHGCNGGNVEDVMNTIKDTGVPLEQSYPYQPNDEYYNDICQANTTFVKLPSTITSIRFQHNVLTHPDQLKQILIQNGPVSVNVETNVNFRSPSDNGTIYNCDVEKWTTHTVLLVGYTHDAWIIKNSWGTGWANKGYAYVPFDHDCGILSEVYVVEVDSPFDHTVGEIQLIIDMVDSYGDAWNGNILGIKQNNEIVATFGSNFQDWSAGSSATTRVRIPDGPYSIVVFQYGYYTEQVGFTIKKTNGEVIFSYEPGQAFTAQTVFAQICETCQKVIKTYQFKMTDSYGDGWNGNVLKVRQGTRQYIVGQNFTTGFQMDPIFMEFVESEMITISSYIRGPWSEQIGYTFRESTGGILAQRAPGATIPQNSVLHQFTPNKINTFPVSLAPPAKAAKPVVKETQNTVSDQTIQESQSGMTNEELSSELSILLVTIICLVAVVLLLIGSLLFVIVRVPKKIEQKLVPQRSVGTASSLHVPEENKDGYGI